VTPLLAAWTELSFLSPSLLVLGLAVAAVVLLRRARRAPAVPFAGAAFTADGLPRSLRTRLAWLPELLETAALLLVVVALARPATRERLPVEREGIDILLCVDTSSSMTSDDMEGRRTRLDVAKAAAARFVAGRPQDRIGLVTFAKYPDVRCPPTLDHEALAGLIGEVGAAAGDGPEDATGIGTAVARAAEALRGGPARARVVVLLTDGAENVATARTPNEIAPLHAAQFCRDLGVRVHAVVAGPAAADAGAPGAPDTRQVARMAEVTGGRFFVARDAPDVDRVYDEIDALEKAAFQEPRTRVVDRFLPFLAAALTCALIGHVLRSTVLLVLP
jgi:Ca-activated chloride channel family protein